MAWIKKKVQRHQNGSESVYYYLVESYKKNGVTHHRTLKYLGTRVPEEHMADWQKRKRKGGKAGPAG